MKITGANRELSRRWVSNYIIEPSPDFSFILFCNEIVERNNYEKEDTLVILKDSSAIMKITNARIRARR